MVYKVSILNNMYGYERDGILWVIAMDEYYLEELIFTIDSNASYDILERYPL